MPTPLPAETFSSEDFRQATEEVLLRQAPRGRAPSSDGAPSSSCARILERCEYGSTDRPSGEWSRRCACRASTWPTAGRALRQLDHTHAAYLKQLYGVDIDVPSLYHMVLDSTTIDIDACPELIALAARSFAPARALPASDGQP